MKINAVLLLLGLFQFKNISGQSTADTSYIKVVVDDEEWYEFDDLKQPISYQNKCVSDYPDSLNRYPQEGILQLENLQDSMWRLETVIISECSDVEDFFLMMENREDTLHIDWMPIGYLTQIEEQIGDTIYIEIIGPSVIFMECLCAYRGSAEFYSQNFETIFINEKALPRTNSFFKTYEIEYFVHQGDTIGYNDKYGRFQGYVPRYFRTTKAGNKTRAFFKNGNIVRRDAYSPNGDLLISEEDWNIFEDKLDSLENK